MLSARTAKIDFQMRKTARQIILNGNINHRKSSTEKIRNLCLGFQVFDYRFVTSRNRFIFLNSTGIEYAATVKYETAAIARFILRNSFFVRKTSNGNRQFLLHLFYFLFL